MPHWHSYTSYSPYFDGSEMTADQVEFLLAVASYQRRFGRRYPTWLEILHIAHCLGYRKTDEAGPVTEPAPPRAGALPESIDLRGRSGLKRDEIRIKRHCALGCCLSMIFSENRFTLFRIML